MSKFNLENVFAHPTSFYFILPKTLLEKPLLIQSRIETLDSQKY